MIGIGMQAGTPSRRFMDWCELWRLFELQIGSKGGRSFLPPSFVPLSAQTFAFRVPSWFRKDGGCPHVTHQHDLELSAGLGVFRFNENKTQ
jgi:hypothetical protein